MDSVRKNPCQTGMLESGEMGKTDESANSSALLTSVQGEIPIADISKQQILSMVDLDEIKNNMVNAESWYHSDYITILMMCFETKNIKVLPANTHLVRAEIECQNDEQKRFVFIPLNVNYAGQTGPGNENHWIAIILDNAAKKLFCLDPAAKVHSEIHLSDNCKKFIGETEYETIFNTINFQSSEIKSGLIHCGPYTVEIFEEFKKHIENGTEITSKEDINDQEINIKTVLSAVSPASGRIEVDNIVISKIREHHKNRGKQYLPEDIRLNNNFTTSSQFCQFKNISSQLSPSIRSSSQSCPSFQGIWGEDSTFVPSLKNMTTYDKNHSGSFWTDIKKNIDGENSIGAIEIKGLLRDSWSLVNPQGIIYVHAKNEGNTYVLEGLPNDPNEKDSRGVYWLPWSSGEEGWLPYSYDKTKKDLTKLKDNDPNHMLGAEFVTIEKLNKSGCHFFLTSSLSGCRFVATDKYLAHFSKIHGKNGSVEARDNAEKELEDKFQELRSTKRLALSQSELSADEYPSPGKKKFSYYYAGSGISTAFIIGIKEDNGTWTIKYLSHYKGCNRPEGVWQTMGYDKPWETETEGASESQ